jgi:DNA-binding SARP family transcriptional activator
MLRVLTLGGLALECAERPLATTHARLQGLGLLARLASAGERGVSREKLVGCFWPEKPEHAALHSLSQALHRLRTELGIGDLVVGTRILRLDPARVTSDVADLDEAHRANDLHRIASLYAGPFLDGIYFHGAPELERWIDSERRRLSVIHSAALRELARNAAAAGDHECAARWWHRILVEDPFDGGAASELVHSLAAAGDEARAIREARTHDLLVRTELGSEPDPRIRKFLDRHGAAGAREADAPPHRVVISDGRKAGAPPTADELCAHARQCFYTFTREGFAEGIRLAERAVRMSPEHAEAHATLGALCIILSQAEQAGDPRSRGVKHCQRAAVLDPMLSEPKMLLAWAAHLEERFADAETLALEGIALDPHGLFANTVLGWVRLDWGLTAGRWDKCVASVASLKRALEINPRDAYVPLALGALFTLAGEHDEASKILTDAIESERWAANEMRGVGALTLQGIARLHAGDVAVARSHLDAAANAYVHAPQIYAPYVNALTLCALGDIERIEGRYGDAATRYARARALLEQVAEMIGCGHLMVRVETRLAGVFRRLRMRAEEERHASSASALTASRDRFSFNWCWGVSEGELHYDWSVYHAECGNADAMVASLRRAIDFGWRETRLLEVEPAFASRRSDQRVQRLSDEVRLRPGLRDG